MQYLSTKRTKKNSGQKTFHLWCIMSLLVPKEFVPKEFMPKISVTPESPDPSSFKTDNRITVIMR